MITVTTVTRCSKPVIGGYDWTVERGSQVRRGWAITKQEAEKQASQASTVIMGLERVSNSP